MVLENDCHTASLMPHFDNVHAVIPYLEPTLRKRLVPITYNTWNCPNNHVCRQKHFSKTKVFFHQQWV